MHYDVFNSYAGLTTITGLVLYVNTPWALGQTNSGTLVQGDLGDLWLVDTGITNETLTLRQGGGLEGNSTSVWPGSIVLAENVGIGSTCSSDLEIRGPISGPGGTLRLLGDVTVGNPDAPSVIDGTLDLWDTRRVFTVTNNAFLDIYASVIGNTDLVKLGGGSLDLFASNACSGLTLVGGGFLAPVHRLALGSTNAGTDYALTHTNVLPRPPSLAWPSLPDLPVVINSRFQVTNTVGGATNRFYRLQKP